MHHERDRHVGEQHEADPLQDGDIALISGEHLEPGAADSEPHDIEAGRATDQQLQRRGHRAEISAQIDGVRKQQKGDDRVK